MLNQPTPIKRDLTGFTLTNTNIYSLRDEIWQNWDERDTNIASLNQERLAHGFVMYLFTSQMFGVLEYEYETNY